MSKFFICNNVWFVTTSAPHKVKVSWCKTSCSTRKRRISSSSASKKCSRCGPDLVKAASGASAAYGHFVEKTLFWGLFEPNIPYFLLRMEKQELKMENWGWIKKIWGRRMENGEWRIKKSKLRMEGYGSVLRISSQDLKIRSCQNNIWYTYYHLSIIANQAILRTL